MHILYIFPAGHFYSANNKKWFRLLHKIYGHNFSVLIADCEQKIKDQFQAEFTNHFNIIYFKEQQALLGLSALERFGYMRALARQFDKLNPDIVHLQSAFNSYMIYPLLFMNKKPKVIYNIWGSDFNLGFYSNLKKRLIIKWLMRRSALVWTNWFALRDKVRDEFPRYRAKTQTILWGTDRYLFKPAPVGLQEKMRRQYNLDDKTYLMLYVRGFHSNSNHQALIESLKFVDRQADFKLILHYPHFNNAFLSNLKEQVEQLGLNDKIIFSHYFLDDEEMKALFEISDLTFSLTSQEQFSRTIFEAILSDTNLILNESPPYIYLKQHFKFNVKTIDVNDALKLGKQINAFIKQRLKPDWTNEKTIIKKHFDFESKAEQYLQIYQKLLNGQAIHISYLVDGNKDVSTI